MPTKSITTSEGDLAAPERVLVVVAHPDDIDFGMAGTVATLVQAGTYVAYCLATSGDAGDDDLTHKQEDLAKLRQGEQTAAASVVGVDELHWLGHPDGMVVADLALRRDLARVIRQVRPNAVLTMNPSPDWDRMYLSHPDHLAVATATMAAIYPDSRNPRTFPELLEQGHLPHTVEETWMFAAEPNRYVDITDLFHLKIKALEQHHSQVGGTDDLHERLSEWSTETAQAAGMAEGRLAEGFRVVPAV